jgi:HPt (histidine-containing phosphotransfer) domain-containing protein
MVAPKRWRYLVRRHASDHYALVLMDLQMPGMNGHEAARAIRAEVRFADLPIVAMTANVLADVRERCLADGMQDYISKPIQPRALAQTVAHWLQGNTPTPSAKPTEMADELATLINFDVAQGLRYMGGQARLYRQMLQRFLDSHPDTVGRLNELLRCRAYDDAARLVHTLKANAASLGANTVAAAAAAIEHWLASGMRNDYVSLEIALEQAMRQALGELATLPRIVVSPPPSPPDKQAIHARDELAALLAAYSGEAPSFFMSQRDKLGRLYDPQTLQRLGAYISQFEFDAASDMLLAE